MTSPYTSKRVEEIEKYFSKVSNQNEDDLVFPVQDSMTLAMNLTKFIDQAIAHGAEVERERIIKKLVTLREKFSNQGVEVYEMQPNTEQWHVLGQASVMVEIEKIIEALTNK